MQTGDEILVAFSGGPDSLALLIGLGSLAHSLDARLCALHLDHGLDPQAGERAAGAGRLAADLEVPFLARRLEVPRLRRTGESLEAAARRVRYAWLEEVRREREARWIATAHHRDDQAETLVLRLAQGTGAAGLAGIRPVVGRVVRPLLDQPRSELASVVIGRGLTPMDDPANRDPRVARSRVRTALLPRLERSSPGIGRRLARLAATAQGADRVLERRLGQLLGPRVSRDGLSVERKAFESLPEELWPAALLCLHRRIGAPHPASSAARRELARQVARGTRLGCDCGGGFRWTASAGRLWLRPGTQPSPGFSYTLGVPGELELPEAGLRVRLQHRAEARRSPSPRPDRAELRLPLEPGGRVTIRSRVAGDRFRPSGHTRVRRLKRAFAEQRVPRWERDRRPVLVVDDQVAWVAGLGADARFAAKEGRAGNWSIECEPLGNPTTALWVNDCNGLRAEHREDVPA